MCKQALSTRCILHLICQITMIGCTMQDLTHGCQPARRHLLPVLSLSDAQHGCSRCVPLPPSLSRRPAAPPARIRHDADDTCSLPSRRIGCPVPYTRAWLSQAVASVQAARRRGHATRAGGGNEESTFSIAAAPILIPKGPWTEVEGCVCAPKGFRAQGSYTAECVPSQQQASGPDACSLACCHCACGMQLPGDGGGDGDGEMMGWWLHLQWSATSTDKETCKCTHRHVFGDAGEGTQSRPGADSGGCTRSRSRGLHNKRDGGGAGDILPAGATEQPYSPSGGW
jgi:hypothetical protein